METREDSLAAVQTVNSAVHGSTSPRRSPASFKVYKRRWLVLLVLCLLNCSNATIWLSFAPVAAQSAQYLRVSLEDINWLSVAFMVVAIPLSFGTTWLLDTFGLRITIWLSFAPVAAQSAQYLRVSLEDINWLSVVFMVVAIPLSFGTTWLLDTFGLRITLVLGAWLNMLGALLRFLGTLKLNGSDLMFLVVMLGQTLSALAQPLIIFTPTKLAALWFPEHQRASANMLASMSNPVGILIANLISPAIAKTPTQIPTLMQAYVVPSFIVCFLASLGVLSSRPPTPPSASAETSGSEPFVQGIKLLLRNKAYLVLLLCFGSGMAVFTCFTTLLEQILCVQGYTAEFTGFCGALFIGVGVVGAVPFSLYVDRTKKFIEVAKINLSLTALACVAFSVVCLVPQQKAAVAVVCSLFGCFGFSIYPVLMELSVECSYPVGEATSAGLAFVSGQVQSLVYILVLQALTTRLTDSPLSTCGDDVFSWKVPMMVMAGLSCAFTCIFVTFFNTRYRRLEVEERAACRPAGPNEPVAANSSSLNEKTLQGVRTCKKHEYS